MLQKSFNRLHVSLVSEANGVVMLVDTKSALEEYLQSHGLSIALPPSGSMLVHGEKQVILVQRDDTANAYEVGSQIACVLQNYKKTPEITVDVRGAMDLSKVIEACMMRYPSFIKYKTKKVEDFVDLKVNFIADNSVHLNRINIIIDRVFEARRIINTAPNHMRPSDMAHEVESVAKHLGMTHKVLAGKDIEKMECLSAVGRGSKDKSRLLVLEYITDKTKPVVALVGKGVTFDTGGYSIKPANYMTEMHSDMSGAATVMQVVAAAKELNLPVNVVAVMPIAENMISDDAMRPEDVYTSYSGQTVHVLNTDAEGRLILADALSYAQEVYKPTTIVDLATLTGAMVVALGECVAGAFVSDDGLFDVLETSGKETHERIWRMPLWSEYDKMCDSQFADMRNVTNTGKGGSATAAAFLGRFVDTKSVKWAHIDIAGTAFLQQADTFVSIGATGFGVRMLLDALNKIAQI